MLKDERQAPVRVIRVFVSRAKEGVRRDQKKRSRLPNFRVKRVRVNCVGLYQFLVFQNRD